MSIFVFLFKYYQKILCLTILKNKIFKPNIKFECHFEGDNFIPKILQLLFVTLNEHRYNQTEVRQYL